MYTKTKMNNFFKNRNLLYAKIVFGIILLVGFSFGTSKAQIIVNGSQTAAVLAQKLTGPGVTVSNPVLTCANNAEGTFTVVSSNLGLDSGIILTSGQAQTIGTTIGCNAAGGVYTTANNTGGDVDLSIVCALPTQDKCILEFDFIPLGDTVKFDYVFGSCEYQGFTCSSFGDAFGFFISGPGIVGPFTNSSKNIALVPGTNCPVGVNTINGSTQNPCGPVNAPCAPPNNVLFNNNISGATVAYNGFTDVLTAIAVVVPCSTYHLKLAVADASDQSLDTGVFLKAGSLSSNAVTFTPLSSLASPNQYIVEGCAPGFIKVVRAVPTPLPYPVNYTLGGTATYGIDYNITHLPIPTGVPGTVTIPAGDTVAYIQINALTDAFAEGTETVVVTQLAPCSSVAVGSASLDITDSILAHIVTPDTAICIGDVVNLAVFGSDSLTYFWTPATNISNPNIKEPTVSPTVTTTYVMHVFQPFSGCDTLTDTIVVTVKPPPVVNIGNDTIICMNQALQFNPTINPVQPYLYSWTGATQFLNATNIINPVGTFTQVGTFQLILNVDPTSVAGCAGADTINIDVLPNDFILHNNDTAICKGKSVQINVTGPPQFTYQWVPSTYLNNPTIQDPTSTPDTSITYTCNATFMGCVPMSHSFHIDVQPNPIVNAGFDRTICNWDTVRLLGSVLPAWYTQYSYNWTFADDISNPAILDPYFDGHSSQTLTLTVTTPAGCIDSDKVSITVNPTEFMNIKPADTIICPHSSVQYRMIDDFGTIDNFPGYKFLWTPSIALNNATISNPISTPSVPIDYTVYTTSTTGCIDTDIVRINVVSDAVLDAGTDQTIYPGETAYLVANGNCSKFLWFPPYQLSDVTLKNPLATPLVTTKYYVMGQTEYGCTETDSITVNVSPETIIDIPNAFSPGSGTSINDELKIIIRGQVATLNYYRIFNRWGQMIFETKDIRKGWNGRFNNVPQPIGSYVYTISAITSNGKKFEKTGNVSLIR